MGKLLFILTIMANYDNYSLLYWLKYKELNQKVILNLVTNAAEAIDRTGTITIRTRNAALEPAAAIKSGVAAGSYVILEVADSGSGIADKDIEHIFEPFYTKKVMGRSGTGLGLAVVWNTIQDHKGGITVTSSNQGTLFTLFFPASADESPFTAATHAMKTGHAVSACTGPRHITWLSALPFCFAIRSRIAK